MDENTIAPFYKLGRRITCAILNGTATVDVTGEVMDTDAGWIAVRRESDNAVYWYNLDYIIHIQVLGRVDHE